MKRSAIRESSGRLIDRPEFRGACHRARIRATRWLHPGYARLSNRCAKNVDGRDEPGHDEKL